MTDRNSTTNIERSNDLNKIKQILPSDDICDWLKNLYFDLISQVKVLNCKYNGLFYEKRIDLPFLSYGSLFLSMKNDINFVFLKNLFNFKSKN